MRVIYEMLKIKFKVEECEDNIYESDESDKEENEEKVKDEKMQDEKTETAPVILSCVGWNAKNMARAAFNQ